MDVAPFPAATSDLPLELSRALGVPDLVAGPAAVLVAGSVLLGMVAVVALLLRPAGAGAVAASDEAPLVPAVAPASPERRPRVVARVAPRAALRPPRRAPRPAPAGCSPERWRSDRAAARRWETPVARPSTGAGSGTRRHAVARCAA